MPPLVRREPLGCQANLCRHPELKLFVCNLKECKQFADKDSDVLLVDEGVRKFKGTSPDGNIAIPETVEDNVTVALHCVGID